MSAPKKPAAESAGISPLTLVKAIWNRKLLIASVWLFLTAVVVVVVKQLPPIYRAQALVQVESQRIPERYVTATVNENLQDRLNLLRQQILSHTRLMQIINKHRLYDEHRGKRPDEDIVQMMREDIGIEMERGIVVGRPSAFRVTYMGPDPSVVAQVTNLIANFFIEENLRAREVEAEGTSQFLDAQLAEAKARLERQEEELSRYKLQHNGELPQQENAMLASISQLKVELTGVQDSISRAQQTKLSLEAALDSAVAAAAMFAQASAAATAPARDPAPPAAASTPAPAAAAPPQLESERLQQQLLSLRMRYSDSHPEVRRVALAVERALQSEARSRVAASALNAGGQAQQPRGAAPPPAAAPGPPASPVNVQAIQSAAATRERIGNLKAQIAALEDEIKNLKNERQNVLREITAIQARLDKLPVREQQLAAITRDYQITRANYSALLDKKLAADLAADMERRQKSERFIMLEMARVPEQPIKPKRLLLVLLGSGFGFVLSLALGLGLELRKGAVMGEWELPQDMPVLGYVPVISTLAQQPGRFPNRAVLLWALATAATICALAAGFYWSFWKVGA